MLIAESKQKTLLSSFPADQVNNLANEIRYPSSEAGRE